MMQSEILAAGTGHEWLLTSSRMAGGGDVGGGAEGGGEGGAEGGVCGPGGGGDGGGGDGLGGGGDGGGAEGGGGEGDGGRGGGLGGSVAGTGWVLGSRSKGAVEQSMGLKGCGKNRRTRSSRACATPRSTTGS